MTEPTRRRARLTLTEVALGVVLVLALVLLTPALPGGAAPAVGDPDPGAPDPPLSAEDVDRLSEQHGRSDLRLELVSRAWDGDAGQWDVVVRATLDSRAICLPIVFDCIVAPARVEGAELVEVDCAASRWRESSLAPGRCVKQLLFAGHGQAFDFTYRTDVGTVPTQLELGARFGRGLLPWILQPLAAADLRVAMDNAADLTMDCGTEPVGPGDPVECPLTMTVADGPDGPPGLDTATLGVAADPAGLVTAAALSTEDDDWNCDVPTPLTCEHTGTPPLEPGTTVEFAFTGLASSTQTGVHDGAVDASLDYGVGPDDGSARASAPLVVAGEDDTVLEVTKTTPVDEVAPGGELRWEITVDNVGFPGDDRPLVARDVVLTDVATSWVTELVVRPTGGVGEWTCDGATCRTDEMPPGRATFEVTARLSPEVPPGTYVVNQVAVSWENDVYGPDFPAVAGVTVEERAPAPAPAPAPSAPPAQLAFTG